MKLLAAALAILMIPVLAFANDSLSYSEEWNAYNQQQDRVEIKETFTQSAPEAEGVDIGEHADSLYNVNIGVYGMENPSAFPNQTWIKIACISMPGASYVGVIDLMWVDIVVWHAGGTWRSWQNGARAVCDINRGIDTVFIAIPRHFRVRAWSLLVLAAERRDMRVRVARTTNSAVHLYE